MIAMKKITIIMLFTSILFAKGGVDISKLITPSFSNGVKVTKSQFKLNSKDIKIIQKSAKAKVGSNTIRLYRVKNGSKIEGYAVLLLQTIRTKKAAVLFVMDRNQILKSVEIVAFSEPREYKPNQSWLDVFDGKSKSDNLFAGKGIPTITGATMSARAISDVARVAIAIVERYK